MNPDERKWIEEATALCNSASRQNVRILMIRKQALNDEADVIVTNVDEPEIIAAMNGNCEPAPDDEE